MIPRTLTLLDVVLMTDGVNYEITLCLQAGAIIGAGYLMKRIAGGGRRAQSP